MRTSRLCLSVCLLMLSVMAGLATPAREQCTSAVISPAASAGGVPMLWKNRDTGVLSNKIVYVRESPCSYLALVNADYPSGRQCFAGLNSAGFAIMNTVAYNLPEKAGEFKDLEGIIMADALRTCRTVDDFEQYLRTNLGGDLGSLANFGVFDATGTTAVFEVHNHGYRRLDPAATPEGYLVVTNFARSGVEGQGAGYLRFERASRLMRALPGKIDVAAILGHLCRDTGHVLLRHPSYAEMEKVPADPPTWILTRDCINKSYTSAAVIMCGRDPAHPGRPATLWVVPGEPVTAVAIPLWVEAGESPPELWQGTDAPLWKESLRIKTLGRPFEISEKKEYLQLNRLVNAEGTGYLPKLLTVEADILKRTHEFLDSSPTAAELARFQADRARQALAAMKDIR